MYLKNALVVLLLWIGIVENGISQQKTLLPLEGEMLFQLYESNDLAPLIADLKANIAIQQKLDIKVVDPVGLIYLLTTTPDAAITKSIFQSLYDHSAVKAVQPNAKIQFRNNPDDPDYDKQWGLPIISAPQVWEVSTGGTTLGGDEIVVAILDSGFDIDHEDFAGNVWENPDEIIGDGIDNDGNGYTDDQFGWDFIADSPDLIVDSHGHSVSGIVGAKGNNGAGVAGVNWNIKMMFFRISQVDQIIEAYRYIVDIRRAYNETNGEAGAFVVATNASFGLPQPTFCTETPIWGAMYDSLGQVGVLTGAGTANSAYNVDDQGDVPTTCESDFLISVLNTNIEDKKNSNSAFGATSIDLGSPGENSFTTKPNDRYGELGGNSAAAPHLTGAISLLYSLPCDFISEEALNQPAETALLIRQMILDGVDPVDALEGQCATGGRLNIFRSMELLQDVCGTTVGDLAIQKLFPNPATESITIEYETPDFEEYEIQVFNALGQLLFKDVIQPLRFGIKRYELSTNSWPSGVYFLALRKNDDIETASFFIEN